MPAKKSNTITVRQVRSTIGATQKQIASVRGLGLMKIGRTRQLEDTSSVRGMVNAVPHLVVIED